jgi:hypothetical protein
VLMSTAVSDGVAAGHLIGSQYEYRLFFHC